MKLFMVRLSQLLQTKAQRRVALVLVLLIVGVLVLVVVTRSKSDDEKPAQRATQSAASTTGSTKADSRALTQKIASSNTATTQNVAVRYPALWETDSTADDEIQLAAPSGLKVVVQTGVPASDGDEDMDYQLFGDPIVVLGSSYRLAGASYVTEDGDSEFAGVFVVRADGSSRQIPFGKSTEDGSDVFAQISIVGQDAIDGISPYQTLSSIQNSKDLASAVAVIQSIQQQ